MYCNVFVLAISGYRRATCQYDILEMLTYWSHPVHTVLSLPKIVKCISLITSTSPFGAHEIMSFQRLLLWSKE